MCVSMCVLLVGWFLSHYSFLVFFVNFKVINHSSFSSPWNLFIYLFLVASSVVFYFYILILRNFPYFCHLNSEPYAGDTKVCNFNQYFTIQINDAQHFWKSLLRNAKITCKSNPAFYCPFPQTILLWEGKRLN